MLDKRELYIVSEILDNYIRAASNNNSSLLDNIIAYMDSDSLNNMFNSISGDWFDESIDDIINE